MRTKKEPPFDPADGIAHGIDCSDADQSGLSHSHGHQSGQTVVHIYKIIGKNERMIKM